MGLYGSMRHKKSTIKFHCCTSSDRDGPLLAVQALMYSSTLSGAL